MTTIYSDGVLYPVSDREWVPVIRREAPHVTTPRGAYTLCLTRPGRKPGQHTTEWLKAPSGTLEEAQEEARGYVSDPRDTVELVSFWSERYQQFAAQCVRRPA